jgi:hypothetical protein
LHDVLRLPQIVHSKDIFSKIKGKDMNELHGVLIWAMYMELE